MPVDRPHPPELRDDDLVTPEIGAWGEEKYRLVRMYAAMFATSMKGKWGSRVYIDLFAGPGRSRIEGTGRIVLASPLLSLEISNRFDRYIFCERDEVKLEALRSRVAAAYPGVDVRYVPGDANQEVARIIDEVPPHGKNHTVLTFCFADPYSLKNLRFETIQGLGRRFVDFLVLIPTGMDANRNVAQYVKPTNLTVDHFLGTSAWRADWEKAKRSRQRFGTFLTNYYGAQMAASGYLYEGIDSTVSIRSTGQNLPLYRLAFFSRNRLGQSFWREARKYSRRQLVLFE